MSEKYYLTEEGHQNLLKEYEKLVKVDKPAILERVKKAREMGNLEDNQEYDAAQDAKNVMEGRIMEIEEVLENVQVIAETDVAKDGIITIGSRATVEVHGRTQTITIVGTVEADPSQGKVSHESPVGQKLLGLKEGDEVKIELPHTSLTYKVTKVHT